MNSPNIALRYPALIAFISSFCLMVLELIAGRIIAPTVGVSLYSWTCVIGFVLAGLSLGNYLGGKLADKQPDTNLLSSALGFAGIATLLIFPLYGGLSLLLASQGFVLKIIVLTFVLFFPPSVFMGGITPILIRLTLHTVENAGALVGRIYALGTVGSLIGTFITGFYLISWLGTTALLSIVAMILLILGSIVGWENAKPSSKVQLLIFMVLLGGLLSYVSFAAPLNKCSKESDYFCINVERPKQAFCSPDFLAKMPNSTCVGIAKPNDRDSYNVLKLDHLVHSSHHKTDPSYLFYAYEHLYKVLFAQAVKERGGNDQNMRVLFIGGGGYTFPRHLAAFYPNVQIDVLEIDPAVTKAAYELMGVERTPRIHDLNQDARLFFIEQKPKERYDFVFGDAFKDLSVPYHLTTKEFDLLVKDSLKAEGIYVLNLIDSPSDRFAFLRAIGETFGEVFPSVTMGFVSEKWDRMARTTAIVIGSKKKALSNAGLGVLSAEMFPGEKLIFQSKQEALFGFPKGLVLTDDFAPVEQLVARSFEAQS